MKSENNFKLCHEDELLLCCARTRVDLETHKRIISLVNYDLDWEHLLQMASRHGLRPLLYHNLNSICPEKVPEDILAELYEHFNVNVRKNLLLTGELKKILELLKSNGINAIPFKGPVLAFFAYGNISFREFSDVDILIDKSYALKAKDVMISNEYELYSPVKVNDHRYLELESEYRFISKETEVNIDINWNFEGIIFSFQTNPCFLFSNLKSINFNSFDIYNFSQVNLLLMLCIHTAKHDWKRLSWLCDISEFLKKNKYIDWDETLEKAEKLGIKRILFINLFLAEKFFDLKIPKEIKIYLDSDSTVIKISSQIIKTLYKQNRSLNIFEKFFLDLRRRDSIFYGFKDCINDLTRYSYKDFEDLPLPIFLFPLYIFIRPFLLLKRYGKDSI